MCRKPIVNSIVIRESVVVDQHGLGNFTTIQEALAAASNETGVKDGFFQIHEKGGSYEEYVSVVYNKKNIMITGDEKNITIITGNCSVEVKGEHFIAINMTFCNIARAAKGQALAVQNNVNLLAFYNCSFECFQDTLCASSGSQFYRNYDIYGTIDFIFGYAVATSASPNVASGGGSTKTYLGRPWGQYSRTVYMQSIMDALDDPLGWPVLISLPGIRQLI
ncbi:putative pectinesterase/pectinesterase inhibitor 41 [Cinnamomum micranthum f. kanehirae]|uniref:Pectinesterase n=1 Tax=Cinnamomum micranthum f. kanehirae TaxID=337451 RepID=A0A3S3N9H1_9MAGN|nr:putative pectinesterase/pectinesterase inhibitor 41 [Cinnamomum micranthum f. kanehirae]